MPNWGELKRRADELRREISALGKAVLAAIEAKDQEQVDQLRDLRASCERELKEVETKLAKGT